MPDPIGPFSPEAVIEAIEADLIGASVAVGRTEEGVVFRGADVTWVYTGHGTMSRVLRARFTPDQVEDRVAEVGDCFRQWGAPVRWVIGPTSYPPELADVLRTDGFDAGHTWLGMACDLAVVAAPTAPSAPLDVRRVTSKQDLATWSAVGTGNHAEDDAGDAPSAATAEVFAPENAGGDPRCRFYLATLAGQPVARGMAYLQDQVVGLHWLAAERLHQDRGFTTLLAHRALADAQQAGARMAVMVTAGPALAVGRELGFRPYCQFAVHAWPPVSKTHA